jgi:hypothetical protein
MDASEPQLSSAQNEKMLTLVRIGMLGHLQHDRRWTRRPRDPVAHLSEKKARLSVHFVVVAFL